MRGFASRETCEGIIAAAEDSARASLGRAPSLMLESSDGTPAFRAPETFEPGEHCGRTADVWSLGVFLFALLTCGRYPFASSTLQGIWHNIKRGSYTPPPRSSGRRIASLAAHAADDDAHLQ